MWFSCAVVACVCIFSSLLAVGLLLFIKVKWVFNGVPLFWSLNNQMIVTVYMDNKFFFLCVPIPLFFVEFYCLFYLLCTFHCAYLACVHISSSLFIFFTSFFTASACSFNDYVFFAFVHLRSNFSDSLSLSLLLSYDFSFFAVSHFHLLSSILLSH